MISYLDFKNARCKNCYKCLRECPVKAIEVINHQAKIIENRCILCGRCTEVCPQNAKIVHSEAEDVKKLISSGANVMASVAPSFVSSFSLQNFDVMKIALGKLGFSYAEETAVGAKEVSAEYKKLLLTGKYKNFITSACPAVNRMIRLYYPKALEFLAPCDSPMLAHAKILKKRFPGSKVVFIGPCIAKKREAKDSGIVDGVLTFEDLVEMFKERNISLPGIIGYGKEPKGQNINKARYYPISRGIIKSFDGFVDGYEYIAVDGASKCKEVLSNIDQMSGIFLELNSCECACVNGPCSLVDEGMAFVSNADIRKYANRGTENEDISADGIDFSLKHERIMIPETIPSESKIKEILARTGKVKKEDELNCGACGYSTCREKAWAVANGYADIEMCVPYMRERAESMSYEIIQNSPNGIILLDSDCRILEINKKAKNFLGIDSAFCKGLYASDCFDASDFIMAWDERKNVYRKNIFVPKTEKYIELSIVFIQGQNVMFGVMKDITEQTLYNEELKKVKMETLSTTDEVIKKQMRVAQEIASLLGETTAETKVALLKLKKTISEDGGEEK